MKNPPPLLPTPLPTVRVVGAALVDEKADGRRCLVARRAPHVKSPGLWEFPGGKIEPGEMPEQALEREIREELALGIEVGVFLGRGTATLGAAGADGRTIVLDVYLARILGGEPRPTDHDELRWIGPGEISGLRWAAADVPVLGALRSYLSSPPFLSR